MINSYWDLKTLLIYFFMGIMGQYCIFKSEKRRNQIPMLKVQWNRYDVVFVVAWLIFATFRYINSNGIGGTDAHNYVEYFEVCWDDTIKYNLAHYEVLYQLINKFIRIFTSNYRILFAIIYGFILFSYLIFIKEFAPARIDYIPFVLVIYVYIRGFVTLRTNLAAAMILVSIVLLKNDKKFLAYILAAASCFIQKASLIYAGYIVFVLFFKKKIAIQKVIVVTFFAVIVAKIAQRYILSGAMGWAYSYYASVSLNNSFFDNFWKIAFEQMVLAVAVIFLRRFIYEDMEVSSNENSQRLKFIWSMCMYDTILIPISYILGIWRAYEYFYIPRVIMWGEIVKIVNNKLVTKNSRKFVSVAIYILCISWLAFRWYNTWQDSDLMPYLWLF